MSENSPEIRVEQSLGERLYAVYETLRKTVTDEMGYGGPVDHEADINGWRLRVATSDFGDLMASMVKEDEKVYRAFECSPDNEWFPMTQHTDPEHLKDLVILAEQADWQDKLSR